tara:strand:- start:430 stop:1185 length:756 start_codon:yes stop_codon:yes gene_type:complete
MNNLKINSSICKKPYIHLVCDDFLTDYHEYDSSYPINLLSTPIRMDKDLTFGDRDYEKIFTTKFANLHNYVYSSTFIEDFLLIFKSEFEEKFRNGELLHNPFDLKIKPQPYELRNFISRNNNIDNDLFLFPRMDFGVGYPGYGFSNGGRGIHTDNVTRLISIMLFFSNQKDLRKGEHLLYGVENRKVKLEKKIEVKKNRLLASIQSNDAYHAVDPLLAGERRAIYMSISCSTRIWKDYEDSFLRNLSKNRK